MARRRVRVEVTECDVCGTSTDPTEDHYLVVFVDGTLEADLCGEHALPLTDFRETLAGRFRAGRSVVRPSRKRGIMPVREDELPPRPEDYALEA